MAPVFGPSQPFYGTDCATFAGGGGGGGYNVNSGGSGGTGGGGNYNGNADANKGGGGGATNPEAGGSSPGNGSDGRVFIRVPSAANAFTISVTPPTNSVVPQPDGVIANFSVSGCFIVS